MKTVLKICCESWYNASRDKRELSVARDLGAKIIVMCKGEKKDKIFIDGFEVHTFPTRPFGNSKIATPFNHVATILTWAKKVESFHPDIISGHNYPALLIGYLGSFSVLRKKKSILIYDSHEFELGRKVEREKLGYWFVEIIERFLVKHCAFSIMVNDVIADEVQKIHNLKQRPIVVRSTPNLWTVDLAICAEKRKELLANMEQPKDFMLMYHGGVIRGRGIETLLELVSLNPSVCAVILGNGEADYIDQLNKKAEKLGVNSRVAFHPAVPIENLWQYVGAADVGMILAPALVKNHLFSLPNKFFENIQSETPIICPDYPAMKPIIDKYKIGLTCNPSNTDEIIACIEKMRGDKEFYAQCKANLKIAKQELCWENEKKILIEAYRKVL